MSNSASASSSHLTVMINGLRDQKGQVCLSLFSQAQGFPSRGDQAIESRCVRANEAALGVTFKNLSPGRYAVAAFHDENSDAKLNTGFLGIPKEEFGFSRNPRIGIGAPRFEAAEFLLTSQETKIQIQLKYF